MTEQSQMPASTPVKDWLIPLNYIIPIVFIYTMMKKGTDSNYVWHAKNGAGALVFAIGLNIIFRLIWAVLGASLSFMLMIFNLINFAFLIVMIYGAWQAWQGKLPNLPVITKIGQMLPIEKWFHSSESSSAMPRSETVSTPATAPETVPASPSVIPTETMPAEPVLAESMPAPVEPISAPAPKSVEPMPVAPIPTPAPETTNEPSPSINPNPPATPPVAPQA